MKGHIGNIEYEVSQEEDFNLLKLFLKDNPQLQDSALEVTIDRLIENEDAVKIDVPRISITCPWDFNTGLIPSDFLGLKTFISYPYKSIPDTRILTPDTIIFDTIKRTILDIEQEFFQIAGKGIFYAPELYISTKIGLSIKKKAKDIFKHNEIEWFREYDLKNGGPSDLIFQINSSEQYVIELKIRNTIDSYIRDIEKLLRLDSHINKYFCVIADSFNPHSDERLDILENESVYTNNIKKVGEVFFKTWPLHYKKDIYAILKLYEVKI